MPRCRAVRVWIESRAGGKRGGASMLELDSEKIEVLSSSRSNLPKSTALTRSRSMSLRRCSGSSGVGSEHQKRMEVGIPALHGPTSPAGVLTLTRRNSKRTDGRLGLQLNDTAADKANRRARKSIVQLDHIKSALPYRNASISAALLLLTSTPSVSETSPLGPEPDMTTRPADKDKPPRRRPGRVAVSCAECRRLKLRCDRKVPCETCVKRGCAAICPDGSLTTGKGNRFVLANTEELHDRIETLCNRIRQLEDALAGLQAGVSTQPHPLLREDLLQLKAPMEGAVDSRKRSSSSSSSSSPRPIEEDETALDSFGTLSIGLYGETKFLGKTARTDHLLTVPHKHILPDHRRFPRLPKEVLHACSHDSDILPVSPEVQRSVYNLLPPVTEAYNLCELYLEHAKYLLPCIPREQLLNEVLLPIYRAGSYDKVPSPHNLSLLFTVFALAALFDLSRPPNSVEAEEYYYLARAALCYVSPIAETTLPAVEALIHMAQYLECSGTQSGSARAWFFSGMAGKLCHAIGLHLNPSRWKLDEELCQRRLRLFWNVHYLDNWLAFAFGRPPSLSLGYVDCDLPVDLEAHINPNGEREPGFQYLTWEYSRLLSHVMETAFGGKTPSYATIIDLDRQVRDFPVPESFRCKCGPTDVRPEGAPWQPMQAWFILCSKEITLLNLHRSYMVDALANPTQDPLTTKYGPSIVATYRSAYRLIYGLKFAFERVPDHITRHAATWSNVFSAAIVLCFLVTRAPMTNLATSSLDELDVVCELFEQAASRNCTVAIQNLESMQKLQRKSHAFMDWYRNGGVFPPTNLSQKCIDADDELDRLGGKTHLISKRCPDHLPPPIRRASPDEVPDNVHPSIMQDLEIFHTATPMQSLHQQQNHYVQNGHVPPHQPVDAFSFSNSLFGSPPLGAFSFQQDSSSNGLFGDPNGMHDMGHEAFAVATAGLDATWQSFVQQLGF